MADKTYTPNFPDLLGEVTDGKRVNIGLVQVALAIRPRVIRAGRPFETIMFVQNASDVAVDFMARVRLPDRDAEGKKERFVCKVDKLVIGLEPAQVGYLVLPVSTLPDTAISADYSITMDVKMKPASDAKPKRVRFENGGGMVVPEHLGEGINEKLDELTHLNWTAEKVGGLRSTGLEVKFGLMSGTVGKIADLKPGWESLWTMADLVDNALLLQKFRKQIATKVLPALTAEQLYSTAVIAVGDNFEKAGFTLSKWERIVLAKMMSLVLVFAAPNKVQELVAGDYNMRPKLEDDADFNNLNLPHWMGDFLNLINREPRALQAPVKAIFQLCFEGLMRDATQLAFDRIEVALGESLGSAKEHKTYIKQLMEDYEANKLGFTNVYLPLVLGGITAADMVVLPNDNMEDAVHDLRAMVDARRSQFHNDDTAGLFQIIDRLMEKVLLKYGYDAKRM